MRIPPASHLNLSPPKKRSDRRQNETPNATREKSGENPIRDWLSTASRKDSNTGAMAPTQHAEIPVSPSWVDDDSSVDDDNSETSGSPIPQSQCYMESPSSPTTPIRPIIQLDDASPDDVYALPPSGQVLEARRHQRGREGDNGGNGAGKANTRASVRGKNTNSRDCSYPSYKANENDGGKTGKGNNPSHKAFGNGGDKSGKGSYAKVVTSNGWKQVESKKRKFNNVSPKVAFPLRGVAATQNRDIYLQGLRVNVGECEDDVIESVRAYCLERGITPVFIRVIPVKFDCTRTGCRLTVRDEDYDRAIMNSFWPDNISARDWTPKPRDNNQD